VSAEKEALNQIAVESAALLAQTEAQLQQLAQQALERYHQFQTDNHSDGKNNHREPDDQQALLRLRQVGEQLARLSQRSQGLQRYVEGQFEAPPAGDDQWPHIKILQSQEEERTQLARELEDSVGQLLANAVFELASCRRLLASGSDSVGEGLDALQQELEQGLADIRYVITDLEPGAILNNFGLSGGIRRYLEQFQTRTAITSQLQMQTNIGRLPAAIEVAIFRVIQEALQNVHRHAGATQVDIVVSEQDDCLSFCIIDDGCGIVSERVSMSKKNFGLARMVDYADLVGGSLRIFSEPEQGTNVTLSVPLHTL
jgi:two-component system sensor histidine kinase DegS